MGGLILLGPLALLRKVDSIDGDVPTANLDIEYFCPMHPYIERENAKEKCPICHMDLAKRKKGTGQVEPLPPGTVNRVQLTPYRVVLAGVQTTAIQYRALTKQITTFGTVEFNETREAHIAARQKGRIEKLNVNFTGQVVAEGEKLAVIDVRYSPELTNTLEDLLRARQSGNREREESTLKRLRVWDIGDEQVKEFLSTGKVGTRLTISSPIRGHVIKKYQRGTMSMKVRRSTMSRTLIRSGSKLRSTRQIKRS